MEQFWTIFWSIIGVASTGLTTWLVAVITSFFNNKIKDTKAKNFLYNITYIVENAVNQITQTYVSTMKEQGKFDKKAQKEAFNKCKVIIESQLTPELKDYISNNYGDITSYITTLIESTILRSK